MSLRDRLTNPKDIKRYDRNYNSMEVYITQGELDKEYIHIPENATNGDMIKALFPDIKYEENGNSTTLYFDKKIGTIVTHDFWNAPYKRGKE